MKLSPLGKNKNKMGNLGIKASFKRIKNGLKKIKRRLFKHKVYKLEVHSILGYYALISVGILIIGMNIVNFVVCLSFQFPQLNISVYNQRSYSQEISSLKKAETILIEYEDISDKNEKGVTNIKDISYDKKVILSKIKYKKEIENEIGLTVTDMSIGKRHKYLKQIENTLVNIYNLGSITNSELDLTTVKLLALRDIIKNSLKDTSNNIEENEEEIELSSATEEEEDNKKIEDIEKETQKEKVVEKKKEDNIDDSSFILKPIDDEIKKIIETPTTETPKTPKSPSIDETKVVKEEKKKKEVENVNIKKEEEEEITIKPKVKETKIESDDWLAKSLEKDKDTLLKNLGSSIFNEFKYYTILDSNFFLENGVWYTYSFSKYHGFGKGVIPNENNLKLGGLNKKTSLLILDNNLGATFATDYKKVKLISNSIISDITNKKEFLKQVTEDKRYLHSDTDTLFSKLKKDTKNLTNGLSNSAKISKIYDYILRNISYSATFDLNNKKIFSGINTFENKVGLCGGYTKLYLYMLSFAGVNDASVVKGHVLDASDFPSIGHAWVRIGVKYYDPTFDDPIGASTTKSYSQYKYFGLPKDLFYTNRYNFGSLPGYLKSESKQSRENIIKENLIKLASKYSSNNYLLLKPFEFRKNYGISYTEKITVEKLKTIIPYHEVQNYNYTENGTSKVIRNIDYYTVNDNNIELLLDQISYNLSGYQLFKWDDGNYRLAYKVSLQ